MGLQYTDFVEIDKDLFRPSEIFELKGDSTKAQNQLNWRYNHSFEDLVKDMVESDLEYYKGL